MEQKDKLCGHRCVNKILCRHKCCKRGLYRKDADRPITRDELVFLWEKMRSSLLEGGVSPPTISNSSYRRKFVELLGNESDSSSLIGRVALHMVSFLTYDAGNYPSIMEVGRDMSLLSDNINKDRTTKWKIVGLYANEMVRRLHLEEIASNSNRVFSLPLFPQSVDNRFECITCCSSCDEAIIYLPCRHVAYCYPCFGRVDNPDTCPICRGGSPYRIH